MGVNQGRHRAGLGAEAFQEAAVAGKFGRHPLDRHVAIQPDLLGEADRAHPALADRVDHLVIIADEGTGQRPRGGTGSSRPTIRNGLPVDVLRFHLLNGPRTLVRIIDSTVDHAYALAEFVRHGDGSPEGSPCSGAGSSTGLGTPTLMPR